MTTPSVDSALLAEATNPETSSVRLGTLLGEQNLALQEAIASNPNLSLAQVRSLMFSHPDVCLQNPAADLWALEDPSFWKNLPVALCLLLYQSPHCPKEQQEHFLQTLLARFGPNLVNKNSPRELQKHSIDLSTSNDDFGDHRGDLHETLLPLVLYYELNLFALLPIRYQQLLESSNRKLVRKALRLQETPTHAPALFASLTNTTENDYIQALLERDDVQHVISTEQLLRWSIQGSVEVRLRLTALRPLSSLLLISLLLDNAADVRKAMLAADDLLTLLRESELQLSESSGWADGKGFSAPMLSMLQEKWKFYGGLRGIGWEDACFQLRSAWEGQIMQSASSLEPVHTREIRIIAVQHLAARRIAAANPKTPKEILEKLATQETDPQLRSALASNPSLPAAMLEKLISSNELEVRERALSNPSLPVAALQTHYQSLSREERLQICQQDTTPVGIFRQLLADPDTAIAQAAEARLCKFPRFVEQGQELASLSSKHRAMLAGLVGDERPEALWRYLVREEKLPEVFGQIPRHRRPPVELHRELLSHLEPFFRTLGARHANLRAFPAAQNALCSDTLEVRHELALRRELGPIYARRLLQDSDPVIKRRLAAYGALDNEDLVHLATDPSVEVRSYLAHRRNLPDAVREVLARDAAPEVQQALALSAKYARQHNFFEDDEPHLTQPGDLLRPEPMPQDTLEEPSTTRLPWWKRWFPFLR